MFHKQLTWACDLIILNACCLTVLQAWLVGMDWIWGISLLNCIAVIALRKWLMKSLQIPWLVSLLNRGLRRIADILVSALFIVTLFPVIIVVQAVLIKSNRRYGRAIFSAAEVCANNEKHFTAIVFSNYPQQCGSLIGLTPVAFKLLTGTISLSDIPSLSVKRVKPDTIEEASDSTQDNGSDNITFKETEV